MAGVERMHAGALREVASALADLSNAYLRLILARSHNQRRSALRAVPRLGGAEGLPALRARRTEERKAVVPDGVRVFLAVAIHALKLGTHFFSRRKGLLQRHPLLPERLRACCCRT